MNNQDTYYNIGFIGTGNMAQAILMGLIDSGYASNHILACSPSAAEKPELRALGLKLLTHDVNTLIEQSDIIIYAAKPQQLANIAATISDCPLENKLIISVAAGLTTDGISHAFNQCATIIRAMPNTPTLLKKGVTGLYATESVGKQQRQFSQQLFSSIGECVWIEHEAQMDAVTAIAGSGPAYFFLLAEAMIDAGVKLGLSTEQAQQLVNATAFGASSMLKQLPQTAEELRQKVTSPGGTTAAAMQSLIEAGLAEHVDQAAKAAYDRGQQLAKQTKG